jgi:hypothetical protein
MNSPENPWVARFVPLLNRDEIRRRAVLRPKPIAFTDGLSGADASVAIESALLGTFYPSEQCVDILFEWVGLANAHCSEYYPGRREFLESVYKPNVPLPEFYFPLCLTGLAGTGKSALRKAFERIMPQPATVTTEDETVFPLESFRTLTVHASSTPKDMLAKLSQRTGSLRDLVDMTRKLAYRDGWAFLCADEFQFVTQSDKANTHIVQMLMSMCYVGIPMAFIANFSLLHKLNARNQEDIHRLLGKVCQLKPESHGSDDWHTLLKWQRDIAPEIFHFDPDRDAEAIHHMTAGVKRAIAKLLKIAFVHAFSTDGQVRLPDLEAAYKADEYSVYRKDIEILQKIDIEHRRTHKDFWCPLGIGKSLGIEQEWRLQRQRCADEAALVAALTAKERSDLSARTNTPGASHPKPTKAKVVPISNSKSLAEQLKDNSTWFQDNC